MTGELTFGNIDHIVKGVEPIVIRKQYTSNMPKNALDGGWSLFPEVYLQYGFSNTKPKKTDFYILDLNRRRNYFVYDSKVKGEKDTYLYKSIANKEDNFHGNTMDGQLSGRTNPQNMTLKIVWKKSALLTLGDGTEKYFQYKKTDCKKDCLKSLCRYCLVRETKPNKNIVQYS